MDPSQMDPETFRAIMVGYYNMRWWDHTITSAALALLLYDIVLTIPEEVKYVFPSQWGIVKVLWYWNRIGSPLILLIHIAARTSKEFYTFGGKDRCFSWNITLTIAYYITAGAINWMFVLTISALYSSNKIIKIGVRVVWVLLFTAACVVSWREWYLLKNQFAWSPLFQTCIGMDVTAAKESTPTHILLASFDVIVFFLTVYKTVQIQRGVGWDPRALLFVLLRDGIIWFGIIIACRITFTVIYLHMMFDVVNALWISSWAVASILFTRIFLSMRIASTHGRVNNGQTVVSIWSSVEQVPARHISDNSEGAENSEYVKSPRTPQTGGGYDTPLVEVKKKRWLNPGSETGTDSGNWKAWENHDSRDRERDYQGSWA